MVSCRHGDKHPTLQRKLIRGLILSLTGYLALSCCALAQTYYVAKTGNDSNSGSKSAPWLTISHAATEATAGSTV